MLTMGMNSAQKGWRRIRRGGNLTWCNFLTHHHHHHHHHHQKAFRNQKHAKPQGVLQQSRKGQQPLLLEVRCWTFRQPLKRALTAHLASPSPHKCSRQDEHTGMLCPTF